MPEVKLHLDADTSARALQNALLARGHNVTRTPNAWISSDASDEKQLMGATAQGRVIFTFNIRDFMVLAQRYPQHHGIVLAAQRRWILSDLISSLDNLLSTTTPADWIGQIRWLNQWRK